MIADHFRTVFAHSYWAWNRVLDQVTQVPQDDYTAPRMLDHESIRATMMHAMGAETGIDLDTLIAVSRRVQEIVGRTLPGQIIKAGKATRRYPLPDGVAARLPAARRNA